MLGIVFAPDWQSRAALDLSKVVGIIEAAERVKGGDVEAMLLPLCLQHAEARGAAAQQDLVEVSLRPVDQKAFVVSTWVLDVAWQWQNTYDGGVPDLLKQVSDQAEPFERKASGPVSRQPDMW